MLCGILNFLKHFARIFTTTLLWSIFSSGCGACVTRVYVSLFLLLYNFRNAIVIMKLVARATFHLRIANRVGEDSCCRGGIVNTRCGCSSCASSYGHSPTALWRFRVSTSNILIDRYMPPHTRTFVIFIILTLNKIFEYVEMTIWPPKRQLAESQGACFFA